MNAPQASVVICTHNPRPHYIARVLDALKAQTLPQADWELLLIDNASVEPLADRLDLTWHAAGRHVREDELGLTPARLRGIAESRCSLIVFVDDDNVLEPGYLAEAVRIADAYPFLGAWGGTISGEFETTPPDWALSSLRLLAIHESRRVVWSNDYFNTNCHPCGAGLCVRKEVASQYADHAKTSELRKLLGRRGASLLSGEDIDLVFCSAMLGLGWGLFPQLKLTHIIPRARLTQDYFIRLCRSATQSWYMLLYLHGLPAAQLRSIFRVFGGIILIGVRRGFFHARMAWAAEQGKRGAVRELLRLKPEKP